MKTISVVLIFLLFLSAVPMFLAADTLPANLSDAEFWKIIETFSEPDGPFPYENFVSNEINYQTVMPDLKRSVPPGGVYIGVAPEQNFTYAAVLNPKISFIVDIRRQNMLELLMYKALFEMSPTRVEFISRLFSRPRPASLEDVDLDNVFRVYEGVPASRALFDETLQTIRKILNQHQFPLSAADLDRIGYVFNAFYRGGPRMDYKFSSATPTQNVPTFVSLMTTNDHKGTNWNFLATRAAYDRVRDMQKRNVIVPLVGDFGGSKTMKSIARYLKQHNAIVSVFYLSNVEYYVQMEPPKWKSYLENVRALPQDSKSIAIRWVSSTGVTSLEPLKRQAILKGQVVH